MPTKIHSSNCEFSNKLENVKNCESNSSEIREAVWRKPCSSLPKGAPQAKWARKSQYRIKQ
jgi:hypothetical protein